MGEIPDDEDIGSNATLPSGERHATPHAVPTVDETLPSVPPRDDGLAAGTVIGRYVIEHRLGAGAMGVVYAARDPELDRGVAIKLLRPGYGRDQRDRLVREAQALARVAHPNVVAVHDVGTRGDQVFVAMELVRGETLRGWLAGPRSQRAILDVMIAAGRGLAAAHAADLVHRDFKPDNVLIGDDGRARVTDFGLARVHDDDDDDDPAERVPGSPPAPSDGTPLSETLTRTGTLLGTPIYSAPEQLAGHRVTPAADQFSFCVAAYEALCGTRPFIATSIGELIARIGRGEIEPPKPDRTQPPRVMQALLRGLSPDPDARYPSIDALLGELTPVDRSRRRTIAIAAAIAVVAAIGAVGIALSVTAAPERCAGIEQPLRAVWNEGVASKIGDRHTVSLLDKFAAGWIDARRRACTADTSATSAKMQVGCLDARLVELREAIAHVIADKTPRARERIERMSSAGTCGVLYRLPLDEARADEVLAIMRVNADTRSELMFGDRDAIVAAMPDLVKRADATGYAPIQADVHDTAGFVAAETGDLARAADEMRAAMQFAEASHDDDTKARVAINLVKLLVDQGRVDDAEHVADLADASIARLGGGGDLVAWMAPARASIHLARKRWHDAIVLLEGAIARRFAIGDVRSLEVANLLGSLLAAYTNAGRYAEARRANDYLAPILATYYGLAGVDTAGAMIAEEHDAMISGDLSRAVELGARSVVLLEEARGADDLEVARRRFSLGVTHELMENWPAMRDAYGGAARGFGKAGKHIDRAVALEGAARAAYELGDFGAAIAELRDCVAIATELAASGAEQLVHCRYALGRALVDSGSIDDGLVDLEWSLPRIEALDPVPRNQLGGVRFAIARALWLRGRRDDRERARVAADAARADYIAHRDQFAGDARGLEALYRRRMDHQVAKLDAWLKNK